MSKEQSVELVDLNINNQLMDQELDFPISKKIIKSKISKFLHHTFLMLRKNYLIMRRNKKITIFQWLSPILVCLLLVFWQSIADTITDITEIEPPITFPEKISRCVPPEYSDSKCITIGYGIIGPREPWIEYAMRYVSASNDLIFGEDVKLLPSSSPQEYSSYLESNMNMTQIGVIFCTSEWSLTSLYNVPCHFEQLTGQLVFYTIVYNNSLLWKSPYISSWKEAYPKDPYAFKLKLDIDNAILSFFSNSTNGGRIKNAIEDAKQPKMNVSLQDYPKAVSRFYQGYDVAAQYGAFYFFIPYMICFICTITDILREKEKRLRQGLGVMGLSAQPFWMSWFLTVMFNNLILTIVLICTGITLQFDFFTKTPLLLTFLLFNLFGMSIQITGFFLSTICSDAKNGYTLSYGFLLMSIVMEFFFANVFIVYFLHQDDLETWFKMVRFIFNFYPAYHFSKIYGDISLKSCKHYSLREGRWVQGPGYSWNDLDVELHGTFQFPSKSYYSVRSTLSSLFLLFGTAIFYAVLTWYCDHVLPSNRGNPDSALFFLTNNYWKCLKRKKGRHNSGDPITKNFDFLSNNASKIDTVKEEKDRVLSNKMNETEVKGLRITRLGKTYRKYPFGLTSSSDFEALRDIYLEVEDGELLGILGHNGAGILEASTGSAEVLNYDTSQNIDEIRSIMGVCPQFDILWDDLTAEEHLLMFSEIKNIPSYLIPLEIDEKLRQVDLLTVKHALISTFSGGMKRRLSIAISAIGNPKIIVLDEPTTGMDPKTRRFVWQMIKDLKKNRVLVLTTHAMEEADALSDRIAVLSEGQLQCIGTPLFLKNCFGDGYRLTLIGEDVEKLRSCVREVLPSSKVVDESGGSLIVGVPVLKINELNGFFRIIENKVNDEKAVYFRSLIKDWGLSNSTLEEVFMKITRQKKKGGI